MTGHGLNDRARALACGMTARRSQEGSCKIPQHQHLREAPLAFPSKNVRPVFRTHCCGIVCSSHMAFWKKQVTTSTKFQPAHRQLFKSLRKNIVSSLVMPSKQLEPKRHLASPAPQHCQKRRGWHFVVCGLAPPPPPLPGNLPTPPARKQRMRACDRSIFRACNGACQKIISDPGKMSQMFCACASACTLVTTNRTVSLRPCPRGNSYMEDESALAHAVNPGKKRTSMSNIRSTQSKSSHVLES